VGAWGLRWRSQRAPESQRRRNYGVFRARSILIIASMIDALHYFDLAMSASGKVQGGRCGRTWIMLSCEEISRHRDHT
jgi:hypothetical protein